MKDKGMARVAEGPPSEERRRQIVEAALAVFARKGYAGATNKDIGNEAGITPGLIYHYFEDKRALFAAVFAEHSPMSGASGLLQTPGIEELDPRVVLSLLATAMVSRLETTENLRVFKLMTGEAMHDPAIRSVLNANVASAVNAVAGYLRLQMDRGRLRSLEPYLVAQLFLGSLMNCVMRRAVTGDPMMASYSREQIAATAVEMALGGLEPARAVTV